MKGKGEVLTYWLVGEEQEYKIKRTEERNTRRSELNVRQSARKGLKNHPDSNACANGAPRSSLKNRNLNLTQIPRNHLSRCASLESPKKLRFASNHTLEFTYPYPKCSRDPLLEVISDSSPSKRAIPASNDRNEKCCIDHVSVSCPCIKNISHHAINILPLMDGAYNSEPTLSASAPVSPSDLEEVNAPLLEYSDV